MNSKTRLCCAGIAILLCAGCASNRPLEQRLAFLESRVRPLETNVARLEAIVARHEQGSQQNDDSLRRSVNELKVQSEFELNRLRSEMRAVRSKTDLFCISMPSAGELHIRPEGYCGR